MSKISRDVLVKKLLEGLPLVLGQLEVLLGLVDFARKRVREHVLGRNIAVRAVHDNLTSSLLHGREKSRSRADQGLISVQARVELVEPSIWCKIWTCSVRSHANEFSSERGHR